MSDNNEKLFSVGEVARKCGVTVRTLQYYDSKGLMTPSGYSEGGRRKYSKRDIVRLQQILFFKSIGFSLEEIRDKILPVESATELETMFKQQKEMMLGQIWSMQETVKRMDKLLHELQSNSEISIDRLFAIMRAIRFGNPFFFIIRHINNDQLQYLLNLFDSEDSLSNFYENLQSFTSELMELYQRNENPESMEAQKLASKWWEMMMLWTKGDMVSLQNIYLAGMASEQNWPSEAADLREATSSFLRKAVIAYSKKQKEN